jgi:hypothetical protein
VYTYSTLQYQIQVGIINNSDLDWTNEESDFDYQQMKDFFFFEAFKPSLDPTHPPFQRAMIVLS